MLYIRCASAHLPVNSGAAPLLPRASQLYAHRTRHGPHPLSSARPSCNHAKVPSANEINRVCNAASIDVGTSQKMPPYHTVRAMQMLKITADARTNRETRKNPMRMTQNNDERRKIYTCAKSTIKEIRDRNQCWRMTVTAVARDTESSCCTAHFALSAMIWWPLREAPKRLEPIWWWDRNLVVCVF